MAIMCDLQVRELSHGGHAMINLICVSNPLRQVR